MISGGLLQDLGVSAGSAFSWAPIIDASWAKYRINTEYRAAASLANILYETGSLTRFTESLNYTPERLIEMWPAHFGVENAYRLGRTREHPADQHMIAELAYGGRLGNGAPGTGDGWKFRGRGLIQLTGRANYEAFARVIGVSVDALITLLESPKTAAESAAAYWQERGCNEVADQGNIIECRRRVQGGAQGVAEVTAIYGRALKLLTGAGSTPVVAKAVVTHDPEPAPIDPDHSSDDLNIRFNNLPR